MKAVWLWIKAICHWLADAWPLWVTFLVILVTSTFPFSLDARVRYCGLVFEVLAIGAVMYGLIDKQRLFKQPGLYSRLRSYLKRLPGWRAESRTILLGPGTISVSAGKARLSSWRTMSSEASTEARLSALEANVETLKRQQGETTKQLQEEITNMMATVNSERQTRESAIGGIRTQLETFGAGSLHLVGKGRTVVANLGGGPFYGVKRNS